MYDCTQGKKVTCLLKPGMKTGKNHSLNDVNLIKILCFSLNKHEYLCIATFHILQSCLPQLTLKSSICSNSA